MERGVALTISLEDARCLGCQYPLRGLDGRRCPECGRGFDPADPRTWGTDRPPGWLLRAWVACNGTPTVVWAVTTVVVTFGLLCLLSPRTESDAGPFILLVGIGAGMRAREPFRAALVERYPTIAPRRRVKPRWFRRVWAATVVLAVASTWHVYTCCHGTRVGLLGVGLAHSVNGGPCNNDPQLVPFEHLFGDWYVCW